MGKTKGPYVAEFPAGTEVKILESKDLIAFKKSWTLHHPIEEEQLVFAGKSAKIEKMEFYHGGDELYVLEGIPGIWHEGCLKNTEL